MAVCTRQFTSWDWSRDLQSQVQRANHYMYLAASCIVTFLYYTGWPKKVRHCHDSSLNRIKTHH